MALFQIKPLLLVYYKNLLVALTELRIYSLKIKEKGGIMIYFSKFQEKSVFIPNAILQ